MLPRWFGLWSAILELCGGSNFVEGETLKNALLPPACGKPYCRLVPSQVSTFEINESGGNCTSQSPRRHRATSDGIILVSFGNAKEADGRREDGVAVLLLKIQNLALLSDNNHDLTSADHTTRRLT